MLEYENQMFLEILQDDGLVITAKGLGLEAVFVNILKAYSDPGQLVLVLGTLDCEEQFFIERLKSEGVKYLPRVITAQCLSEEREVMYLEGGVLFISGRILVVDLLKNRVPLKLVSGILVYRAHAIMNSYQEAFALRLYRQKNKIGFIKAFTSSALAFTIGFAQVERVMKALFVKNLYLWPRFHSIVKSSLSTRKPEVIELHAKLTPKMISIQSALLDVMNFMVKDLKTINKYLDLDELTVENVIAKKFHKQLQQQLDPIWNQLSFKTKQLIADLKTLRSLLICLTHEDSVSFYAMLSSLRTMDYAMKSSGWTVLDVVDAMFKSAKSRVYNDNGDLNPEPNPKWTALSEVLTEIHRDSARGRTTNDNPEKVLLLTQDSQACNQLKNYLTMGGKQYLLYRAMKKLQPKSQESSKQLDVSSKQIKGKSIDNNKKDSSKESENEAVDENMVELESYVLTLSQKLPSNDNNSESSEEIVYENYFEDCSQLVDLDLTTLTTKAPMVVVQSLKRGGDTMALQRTLLDLVPTYVIMYAADLSIVRQLEVYQNKNPSISLKVYFLIYGGSVEEQAYLTSLHREKIAFDKLITTKTTMVVPEEQDGKSDYCDALNVESVAMDVEANTRKGGLKPDQVSIVHKIIVDIREFGSELPSLIHKRGIEIEPVTLLIGDYILSPDICIERKSISDLIGSLNSGRLYNQAVSMCRYYAKPMLLIEFDQNKPFSLQGNYYVSRDMKSTDITAKLQLLTLHFPRLKLVWSPSPHASAQLFEELKQGRPQPDALKAAQVGVDDNTDDKNVMAEKYNCHIQDLIAKLPGVHSKNLRLILNKGISLDHLITLSQDDLSAIMGNKNDAELLYQAFHDKYKPAEKPALTGGGRPASKVKTRGLFFKKK